MRDYQVWAAVMLKGGVRKTTTAAMLAFALAERGEDVLVIDADTHTQGLTEWVSGIYADQQAPPFDMVQWSRSAGTLLVPFIQAKQRETGARFVILDMGAEDPNAIRQLLPLLDLAICPCGPESAELSRLPATRSLLDAVPMRVLLTRVDQAGAGAARQTRAELVAAGYDVMTTEVARNRELYAHVFGTLPADLGAYRAVAEELAGVRVATA